MTTDGSQYYITAIEYTTTILLQADGAVTTDGSRLEQHRLLEACLGFVRESRKCLEEPSSQAPVLRCSSLVVR